MSRRTKVIIAVLILLALLLVALYFFMLRGSGTAVVVEETPLGTNAPVSGLVNSRPGNVRDVPDAPVNGTPAPEQPVAKPDERVNLQRIAAAFAERYGSFSNQSDYENVLDLKVYMSAAMAAWADEYVAEAKKRPKSAEYFGVTTRSLNTTVTAFHEDVGEAQVEVKTQRQETSGTQLSGDVYYQDITIDFVREGTVWKVSGATWAQRE